MQHTHSRRRTSPWLPSLLLIACAAAAGCATRSISNPVQPYGNANLTYGGELSDFDVVGAAGPGDSVAGEPVSVRPHSRVLVVQSGALFPDQRFLDALAEHFEVSAASGIPTPALRELGMRQAAARGGFDTVLAYWGTLESSERHNAGVAVRWVPIAGWFVPDTSQRMRLRLRLLILDVASGRWTTLLPAPMDDERASSLVSRERSDRDQVADLMAAAIPVAVEAISKAK